ncbi:DNA repair protein RadC [Fibrobacter sp. UWB15]|uniref:RadC family protein n=1 Tax=unclassified Fibrobacter TaxID=2634177 RepID=UPI000918045A|nr:MULTISPECIES: DNA repair protein RadC [unclassified Fibrobacter]PWJ65074.1 DNA repair protein RadC [Fibrobacter sp. UWB6]SHG09794.1 DNA repair protein RadC [Fibrobacter sp. UWB8]SMG30604.1 DNA repair protein RadC [Fibrobacter sp. UWB15]
MNPNQMMFCDKSARIILPREKIEKYGASALTNEELLALILGSGNQDCNVFELSRQLADFLSDQTQVPTLDKIREIRGLGKVKSAQILACLELSGRYILSSKSSPIMAPEDLMTRLSFLKYEEQEHLVVVTLNSVNCVIRVHEITTGLVNKTPVHPREAFAKAIEDRAVSVVFAHNHPSGSLEPSSEDLAITRVLCASGRILQIPVLDHVIVGKGGLTSICRMDPGMFEKTFSPA